MHIAKWTVLLGVFWILLSGYLEPLLLFFGAVSVLTVMLVLNRMDAVDEDPRGINFNFSFFRYVFWLIGQIVSSSIHVTQLIWRKSGSASPALAKISVDDIPKDHRVLYANSITLTPGTLSVDLDDHHVTVHALQAPSISKLAEGNMEHKVKELTGEHK
ncbi:Na+/H+ antiporter subunit E [Oceaniserpentilla sp. 4NH20-0058]|uniref:Na+/H+ antiporter subunit E n=1 Tax=Oceaniserpentilla sp. 4NH20-0058 TaxID=3127660 RepID=UPI00310B7100